MVRIIAYADIGKAFVNCSIVCIVHVHGNCLNMTHKRASEITNQLCDHSLWLSHSSRITRDMALDICHSQVTHPEDIPGLARAIKRFWGIG